ncbi:6-pyruvoyl trahydropterin synthase family protein [Streptomyces wuyuanensis]|uniref:6-carboxy-5,6,7,8-tetrahydropterin synthase n=1 Tax=Streptomyces wuyuanensis TaxID=1196353 RepID=A0A1H0DK92_9ACTN|nr:6-carboxytetrahydropterin synthase [Streptomyces wuyuanensis]SDN70478.1 6-pyruvoyltetrahydropterin/6-carboxytetrahydropterin synthase [Streptomyces wuyuanensis]
MDPLTGHHRIAKRFTFEAAHRLSGLPDGHKCARLHGHSYTAEIVLTADDLVPPGFVTDFVDLAVFGVYLNEHLNHRILNDVLPVSPTSENLAHHLAEWFIENVEPRVPGRLAAVRVSETASSWAEYVAPSRRSREAALDLPNPTGRQ